MKTKHVERYTIPITGSRESLNWEGGTTVKSLLAALRKLPPAGQISIDYGQIYVTHIRPDIETPGE
ncbi:hypothetical protein PBI_BOGOSYJAY_45 [Mycobacterium phage BogosyJay]|nr:hypothetical protein PBI_MAMINIAINA_45 [Mycobacterium phage Maminiaina]QFG14953.1 hypothetical protein PBI_BOGOSYJAY_45 [Mycobacterium phage BogosyJay]